MFTRLSVDNLVEISQCLSPASIIQLSSTCNYLHQTKNQTAFQPYFEQLVERVKWITNRYPPNIRSIFGGVSAMIDWPIIVWQDKFIASTDYIDNILPEDMYQPIVLGEDRFDRPFIALRVNLNDRDNNEGLEETENKVVEILFQRHSGTQELWTNGCRGYGFVRESGYWYKSGNIVHRFIRQNIENLLSNKGYISFESPLFSETCMMSQSAHLY